MGRIADAALALLASGPRAAEELGAALAGAGVTRAGDPVAAVRRALRDDPRVVRIADGRYADLAVSLSGVRMTTLVDADAHARGRVDLEPDLAPLSLLGAGSWIALPPDAEPGDVLVVTVAGVHPPRFDVARAGAVPGPVPGDEAAIMDALATRLERRRATGGMAPPITHLGTLALGVAAAAPHMLRTPGRPLGAVLAGAGYEHHLGWVGPPGTRWSSLTDAEVEALEARADELLRAERTAAAAEVQERLTEVLRRHRPARLPAARRRLARMLTRDGRPAEALDRLREGFAEGDPDDWYEAALVAQRLGDDVRARRWIETGLAHADTLGRTELVACLADLGEDLDAQAAFARARGRLPDGEGERDGTRAEVLAQAIAGTTRSYLVEALVEGALRATPAGEVGALVAALSECGAEGREACRALAAILPPGAERRAAEAAGGGGAPRAAVAGLIDAAAVRAWATSPLDAPDQQQIVIAVAKEEGRLSPLVVLVDIDEMGGAVKDAFFLPDLAAARLRRELLDPMAEIGLPADEVDVHEAIAIVQVALARTAALGWRLPSLRTQPVLERIERWLLRPRHGDAPAGRPLGG